MVCVCVYISLSLLSAHCIVKMCHLSAMQLSRCRLSAMQLSRCVIFRQCNCQDVLSFGNVTVKMCCLSAIQLSRCVIFWQGLLCVCVCVCVCTFLYLYFSPLYRQNVSSFGSTTVKMCHLSAGAIVCVCVCVHSFIFAFTHCIVKMCRLSAMQLSRCVVFQQGLLCGRLLAGAIVCVCVCVCVCVYIPLSLLSAHCIVKMCRLSAIQLSRCRLLAGAIAFVCVLVCVYIPLSLLSAHCIVKMCHLLAGATVCVHACVFIPLSLLSVTVLSRCVVFRQRLLCVCVCVCACDSFMSLSAQCVVKM